MYTCAGTCSRSGSGRALSFLGHDVATVASGKGNVSKAMDNTTTNTAAASNQMSMHARVAVAVGLSSSLLMLMLMLLKGRNSNGGRRYYCY